MALDVPGRLALATDDERTPVVRVIYVRPLGPLAVSTHQRVSRTRAPYTLLLLLRRTHPWVERRGGRPLLLLLRSSGSVELRSQHHGRHGRAPPRDGGPNIRLGTSQKFLYVRHLPGNLSHVDLPTLLGRTHEAVVDVDSHRVRAASHHAVFQPSSQVRDERALLVQVRVQLSQPQQFRHKDPNLM